MALTMVLTWGRLHADGHAIDVDGAPAALAKLADRRTASPTTTGWVPRIITEENQ